MKIISVVGNRGSGKTMTSIDLANDLAAQGYEVRVVFEGPEYYARSMTSLLHYGARGISKTGHEDRGLRCDYLIYDGYLHPRSNQKHDLSPYITEELLKKVEYS